MERKPDNDSDVAQRESYYIEPGYIYFTRRSTTIETVVANCVAVCIWDRALKYGGMSHFLRPIVTDKRKTTARFGNVAMATLVRIMEEAGCNREDLAAQIFSGCVPDLNTKPDLGAENVKIAREVLERKKITIISEDVGGSMGRKIVFDTATGETVVMKVHNVRESDWI